MVEAGCLGDEDAARSASIRRCKNLQSNCDTKNITDFLRCPESASSPHSSVTEAFLVWVTRLMVNSLQTLIGSKTWKSLKVTKYNKIENIYITILICRGERCQSLEPWPHFLVPPLPPYLILPRVTSSPPVLVSLVGGTKMCGENASIPTFG